MRLVIGGHFLLASLALTSCSGPGEHGGEHRGEHGGEHGGSHEGRERGEHDREGGRGHDREGEESGTELALDATYDKTRRGAHLQLAFDAATNSFVGTVENKTKATLPSVRVEVHLSNGKELGPTKAQDLAPGQKLPVRLKAESNDFERWTAHPEVGRGEHGNEEHK